MHVWRFSEAHLRATRLATTGVRRERYVCHRFDGRLVAALPRFFITIESGLEIQRCSENDCRDGQHTIQYRHRDKGHSLSLLIMS